MINKKSLLGAVLGISMMASFTAFAASGDALDSNELYSTIYSGNKIVAGEGIPAGEYCLFNKSETKSANYSIKSGTYRLISDTFSYNAIVDLDADDVLYMENCYAVPLEEAKINPINECMVKVGEHIKAGKYSIKFLRDNSQTGTCVIYDSLDFHEDEDDPDGTTIKDHQKVTKISNGGDTEITLEDDTYVKLDGCYLYDVDEDKK